MICANSPGLLELYRVCRDYTNGTDPLTFVFIHIVSHLPGPIVNEVDGELVFQRGSIRSGCPLDPNYLPIANPGVSCTDSLLTIPESAIFEDIYGLYDQYVAPVPQ